MKNILLVDDEPMVIQIISEMLGSLNNQWKIFSAHNAQNAIEIMETNSCDIIISDMNMPEMKGTQLLEYVKNNFPGVVRIILSGDPEKEDILESIKPAHQFLNKPCSYKTLTDVINQAINFSANLKNENLKELISRVESLPSLPSLYSEINTKLSEEDVSIKDIAEIIKKDVSMAAEILKLVNSSFFGFSNPIMGIEQATALLGLNNIKTLVLSIKLFSQFSKLDQISISIDELWEHSFLTAVFSGEIIKKTTNDKNLFDKAFTTGLLHDIGIITLASQLPQSYKKAYENALITGSSISESEYRFFGTSHSEVGAYLTGIWGLPAQVSESIANHHLNNQSDDFQLLNFAVHSADVFSQQFLGKNQGLPLEEIHTSLLKNPEYQNYQEEWFAICENLFEQEMEILSE